jgi:uncharacterized protein
MQERDGRLTLAASDLGRFLSCRHLTALDIEVAQGLRKRPPVYSDPILELLIQRGLTHEKEYTEKVEASGSPVLDLSPYKDDPADAFARTVAAMKKGRPAIAQAALAADGWYGVPDLLQKVDRRSKLGSWSYEAYDTKLARETRGTTILQLSFYSELLDSIQGAPPERFYVVTPIATEDYRVADYAAYYRLVKRNLQEVVGQDTTAILRANYPEPVDHCDVCRWSQQCDKRRRADDHLSLVAGITRLQRRELEAHRITTLEHFGDLRLPLPFKPSRGSKESFEKAQNQARIQLEGRRKDAPIHELLEPVEEGRGLALLPEPSSGDVFLDLEGDHFAGDGGREYLFGMTVVGPKNQTTHRKIWATTEAEEKSAFEAILDDIRKLWGKNPGMHVYHYAPYEPSAFKRLMCRHAVREQDVDEMLRAGLFVDLCTTVKQGLRASVESYSIKDLERFYGFVRKTPLKDAGSARRAVEFSLEMEDPAAITPEIHTLVENYNQEDCVSALELRKWLESLRLEHEKRGTTVPRPLLKDGKASEKVEERAAEVQAAMTDLLDGVPAEKKARSPEQQARWLLAHMLEFHRREDKVVWWEFFRLCGLADEDDLLAERAVVAGLQFVKRTPPTGRERIPTDRYRFPAQEFEAREGDDLITQDATKWGKVASIDLPARWVEVKKTANRKDDHPRVAFVQPRRPASRRANLHARRSGGSHSLRRSAPAAKGLRSRDSSRCDRARKTPGSSLRCGEGQVLWRRGLRAEARRDRDDGGRRREGSVTFRDAFWPADRPREASRLRRRRHDPGPYR